jgi:hypothetical protein
MYWRRVESKTSFSVGAGDVDIAAQREFVFQTSKAAFLGDPLISNSVLRGKYDDTTAASTTAFLSAMQMQRFQLEERLSPFYIIFGRTLNVFALFLSDRPKSCRRPAATFGQVIHTSGPRNKLHLVTRQCFWHNWLCNHPAQNSKDN